MTETVSTRIWGLTGGIASGKSTVARLFEAAGIPVIDADQVSRSISAPGGRAHAAVLARFGTADRAKLREIIFKDPAARRDLEAIVHPAIREESLKQIQKLRAPVVLYEATLLVETGRYKDFEGLITVEAPLEVRIVRVMARDGGTREHAEQIIAAQLSDDERRKAAQFVVTNSGDLESLRIQVEAIARAISTRSPS